MRFRRALQKPTISPSSQSSLRSLWKTSRYTAKSKYNDDNGETCGLPMNGKPCNASTKQGRRYLHRQQPWSTMMTLYHFFSKRLRRHDNSGICSHGLPYSYKKMSKLAFSRTRGKQDLLRFVRTCGIGFLCSVLFLIVFYQLLKYLLWYHPCVLLFRSCFVPFLLQSITIKQQIPKYLNLQSLQEDNQHQTYQDMLNHIESLRSQQQQSYYRPIQEQGGGSTTTSSNKANYDYDLSYDIYNCPWEPPLNYPYEFPIMNVLQNWPITSTSTASPDSEKGQGGGEKDETKPNNIRYVHHGLCIFDFAKVISSTSLVYQTTSTTDEDDEKTRYVLRLKEQIQNYRKAEVPFIVKNDPTLLQSVQLWNQKGHHDDEKERDVEYDIYLKYQLQGKLFHADLSSTTSMMYHSESSGHVIPKDYVPPTKRTIITYQEWYQRAKVAEQQQQSMGVVKTTTSHSTEYTYLRVDGCPTTTTSTNGTVAHQHRRHCDAVYQMSSPKTKDNDDNALSLSSLLSSLKPQLSEADFIMNDLPFFNPNNFLEDHASSSSLYLVEPRETNGIQCRLGMKGLIAENHFDNERNFITILKGERRYILGHPQNCPNMYLYPQDHPLERHSQVNWNNPNLQEYPNFKNVHVNEVVLQVGDVLYLPTYWFHHIISLTLNYQCNTRSGHSLEYDTIIDQCGFLYLFPE